MGDSRTADKFVVRLPDGVRAQIEAVAAAQHIAMNTFMVQAAEEKLARGARQELLLDALEQAVTRATTTTPAQSRLIGWRTADYLMETADPKIAKNWEIHHQILPIFEGDAITKLPSAPVEASA